MTSSIKTILKTIIPGRIRRIISGIYYGWHGDYKTWEEAKKRCTGYDSEVILEKVKDSLLKVKSGEAAYERDSVLFDTVQYSFELLSALMWIAARNNGKLSIIDFGGSLGTTYFQNKKFLDSVPEVSWNVVEQENFVKAGRESFEDSRLKFFSSFEECRREKEIHAILFSSVLQYLEDPSKVLDSAKSEKIMYIIIDRTPFMNKPDRITIQRVRPSIYRASYPCRFFNKKEFISRLTDQYELVFEFDSLDRANIRSDFKGMLFERKSINTQN